ncbi:kinase-like protein [Rhodotorula sp. JG-1b]|nr:kinase-like protein [Rhodotorula sp. JG-1b]
MRTGSADPIVVQIPPETSPVMLPTQGHRRRVVYSHHHADGTDVEEEDYQLEPNYRSSDLVDADDLEFVAPGQWDGLGDPNLGRGQDHSQYTAFGDDDDDDDDVPDFDMMDDGDHDVEDWTLEDGHVDGVPCCNVRLDAKMYQQPAFLDQLMVLLRDELATPGWATLPRNLPSTVIQVQRISGALTNAVFFVSIPDVKVELAVEETVASPQSYFDQLGSDPDQDDDADVSPRALPATVFSELERGRAAASTPRPREVRLEPAASAHSTPQVLKISLPGSMPDEPAPDADSGESSPAEPASPSSAAAGSSRVRIESTTLSAPTILLRVYGPQSGSLISRRTELHILHTLSSQYGIGAHVLGTFANGRVEEYFHSRALVKEEMRDPRVSRWIGRRMRELHSVDLQQIIPPPTEEEMARDEEKRRRTREKHAAAGSARPVSVGDRKRPRQRGSSSRGRQWRASDKLCVWENITCWTRQAKNVLRELDELAQLPGFAKLFSTASSASTPSGPGGRTSTKEGEKHVTPLASPARTFAIRSMLNIPLFEQQVRLYRQYVHRAERAIGKSKRVFAHNDTQYGNLLLVTPTHGTPEEEEEIERTARREGGAHRRIVVIDFEYAGANPRGFDIANHFCEWQADYHHPSLSHSLSSHQPYPTASEKARFLRAYVGCDQGYDGPAAVDPAGQASANEDVRVKRLLDEIRIWEPSSHAMWAVWGIVQAKDDLLARIRTWKERASARDSRSATPGSGSGPASPAWPPSAVLVDSVKELGLDEKDVEELADLDELEEVGEVFDYLSYAAERMGMFRRELAELGVI